MFNRRAILAAPALLAPALARSEVQGINVNTFLRDAATKPGGRELQLALNASAKSGLPAYIPAGCTVILRDEPSVVLPSGSSLMGDGSRSVLTGTYTRKIANCLLQSDWSKPVEKLALRNFAIDRSGIGVEHGILLNGVDGLTIDQLRVSGASLAVSGILSISGVFRRSGNAPRLPSRNILITNSDFGDCGNFGVQFGAVSGAIIRGCRFPRAFREAVGVEPEACTSASSISITGNQFFCTPNLKQGSETGVIVVTMTSGASSIRKIYIANNIVEFGPANKGKVMPAIGLYGHIDVLVEKNVIRNSAGPGIQLGNLFETAGTCRQISGRLTGARVLQNQIASPNMGHNEGGMGAAIYARGAEQNIIIGNRVTGYSHTSDIVQDNGSKGNRLN